MFTPPPSPMPFPKPDDSSSESPTSLHLTTPDSSAESLSDSPKSPSVAEAGPSRIPMHSENLKKRTGRRTLLLVAILPATLILTASLRHFLPTSLPTSLITFVDRPPVAVSSLGKREPQSGTASSSSAPPQSSLSTPTPTTTALPTIPTDPVLPTPFPQPFDAGSLSYNFSSQACQAFFLNFTQNEEFRQCRAMSFLLNSSSAFLQAQQNLTEFNSILFGTCNTPRTTDQCKSTMDSLLSQLNSQCKEDIADQNQGVLSAQNGFQSYTAMRTAGCIKNPTDNSFCYMDAVAASTPNDLYFYSLPLGTPIPNGVTPTCGACVKSVMGVFAQYVDSKSGSGAVSIGGSTGNSTASDADITPLPVLSKTYPAAARLAVDTCGGTYASVGVATPNGALHQGVMWSVLVLGLLLGSTWVL